MSWKTLKDFLSVLKALEGDELQCMHGRSECQGDVQRLCVASEASISNVLQLKFKRNQAKTSEIEVISKWFRSEVKWILRLFLNSFSLLSSVRLPKACWASPCAKRRTSRRLRRTAALARLPQASARRTSSVVWLRRAENCWKSRWKEPKSWKSPRPAPSTWTTRPFASTMETGSTVLSWVHFQSLLIHFQSLLIHVQIIFISNKEIKW